MCNKISVKASTIAYFLNTKLVGTDVDIISVSSIDNPKSNSLLYSKFVPKDEIFHISNSLLILSYKPTHIGNNAYIIVENPRLSFIKVVEEFFVEHQEISNIGTYSVIDPTAKIGKFVKIGNNCVIGKNVVIGKQTIIGHNTIIADNVKIGNNCLIRSCAVIGEEGFGFEYDSNNIPIRNPHFGSVEIGDFVEIGNFTSIARGVFENTIIKSYVKIDNLVHIAHNCIIGEKTLIIAHAEISGGVIIGDDCWIGVGCCTKQKIKIGGKSIIGAGAVVVRDVEAGTTVIGNPARKL